MFNLSTILSYLQVINNCSKSSSIKEPNTRLILVKLLSCRYLIIVVKITGEVEYSVLLIYFISGLIIIVLFLLGINSANLELDNRLKVIS